MTEHQPMLPGMPDDVPPAAVEPAPAAVPARPASVPSAGFSTAEKLLAVDAARRAPLTSGLAASAMLTHETDPTRRHQLELMRTMAFVRWGVGAVVGVIALIVILSAVGSHSEDGFGGGGGGGGVDMSGPCRGEADRTALEDITYESDDNLHWTGTYPCTGGGSTRLAARPGEVP